MPKPKQNASLGFICRVTTMSLAVLFGGCAGSESELEPEDSCEGDMAPGSGSGQAVLIFYGHSGVAPPGIFGYVNHESLQSRYQQAGLSVNYSDQWPDSTADLRLIILVVPGSEGVEDFFSDGEVCDIKKFVNAGGVLFIENEFSYYAGTPVINDLLTRLGSTVRADDKDGVVHISMPESTTEIGSSPFTEGVQTLGFDDASAVQIGSGISLASSEGKSILASEDLGSGTVILSGDGNIIDDYALESFASTADNLNLADNIARLK